MLGNAGRVSRADADQKAAAEYVKFDARRRELAEANGEEDALKALEDAAKKLPKRRGRKPKDDGGAS